MIDSQITNSMGSTNNGNNKKPISMLDSINKFESLELLKGCCTQGCCNKRGIPSR